ncbi:hypothetical protein IMY05_001G0292800 [Salix suchowensis]|nr:hypothetical protein IMY05_001G0292800 [Salix suchowensis]
MMQGGWSGTAIRRGRVVDYYCLKKYGLLGSGVVRVLLVPRKRESGVPAAGREEKVVADEEVHLLLWLLLGVKVVTTSKVEKREAASDEERGEGGGRW